MGREVTIGRVLSWTLVLAASVGALSCSVLMLLAGRDRPAAVFAAGGLCLAIWAGMHLTDGRSEGA